MKQEKRNRSVSSWSSNRVSYRSVSVFQTCIQIKIVLGEIGNKKQITEIPTV